MKHLKEFLLMGCLAVMGIVLVPNAKADQYSQKTTFTFSGPVELPGITLPAGTYVFRIVNMSPDTNDVEVMSANEQKVFAVIRTVPEYRANITDKTAVNFEERAQDSPEAIKDWFFPDNHYGQKFIYPELKVTRLAKANAEAIQMAANATKSAK